MKVKGKGPPPIRSPEKQARTDARLMQATGRGMLPHFPHNTLLSLVRVPPDRYRPGDVVAWQARRKRNVGRLIDRDRVNGRWIVMADGGGMAESTGVQSLKGAVTWSCYRGRKSSALPGDDGTLDRYLKAAREKARLLAEGERGGGQHPGFARRIKALFLEYRRRALCAKIKGAPLVSSGDEGAYLLKSLRAVLRYPGESPGLPEQPFDWDICLELALTHSIVGIVGASWLRLKGPGGPPAEVKRFVERELLRGERLSGEALKQAARLETTLGSADVPMLVLKGPALSWGSYERPAERIFGDVDILVPEEDLQQALAAMKESGFRAESGATGEKIILRGHFHIVLRPPPGEARRVELHWGLVDRANFFRVDCAGLFARSRTVPVPGGGIPTLSPEDELVYLCLHLCKHGVLNRLAEDSRHGLTWILQGESGNRLLWFVDLLRCLSRKVDPVDMEKVRVRAAEWNAEEETRLCLLLTRKLFPDHFGKDRDGCEAAARDVFHNEAAPGFRMVSWRRRMLTWAMRPLPVLVVRPVRILEMHRLFFPPAAKIRRYYGIKTKPGLVWARLRHPLHMARRLFLRH